MNIDVRQQLNSKIQLETRIYNELADGRPESEVLAIASMYAAKRSIPILAEDLAALVSEIGKKLAGGR